MNEIDCNLMILHSGIFLNCIFPELTCLKLVLFWPKPPETSKTDFGPSSDSNVQQYMDLSPTKCKSKQTREQEVISGMRQLSSRLFVLLAIDNMLSLSTSVFVLSEIRPLSPTLSSHCLYPVAAQRRTAAARQLVWQSPDFSLKTRSAHIPSAHHGTMIDILSCDFFFRFKSIHLDLLLLHQNLK